MKVALPVWEERISPVFDAARTILVLEIDDRRVVGRRLLPCCPDRPREVADLLRDAGVSVLICGAISREPASLLESRGIRLVPFIAGRVEPVVASFLDGTGVGTFRMPGCRGGGRRRSGGCRVCCDPWAKATPTPAEEE